MLLISSIWPPGSGKEVRHGGGLGPAAALGQHARLHDINRPRPSHPTEAMHLYMTGLP